MIKHPSASVNPTNHSKNLESIEPFSFHDSCRFKVEYFLILVVSVGLFFELVKRGLSNFTKRELSLLTNKIKFILINILYSWINTNTAPISTVR